MKKKKKRVINLPKAAFGIMQGIQLGQQIGGGLRDSLSEGRDGILKDSETNMWKNTASYIVDPMSAIKDGMNGTLSLASKISKQKEENTNRQRGEAFNKTLSNVQNYDLNIPTFAMGGNMGQDPSRMGMGMQKGMQMKQQGIDNIQGNTHEQGGTNIGNVVEAEKGETKDNNVIYSDRLKITAKDVRDYALPKSYRGKTIAEVSKIIDKQLGLRKYDSIDNEERQRRMDVLTEIQEDKKVEMQNKQFEGDMESIGMGMQDSDRAILEQQAMQQQQGQQGEMQIPENNNIQSPENQQTMQMQMMQQGQGMQQMWAGGRLPIAGGGIILDNDPL